jgi:hypothetical protein
VVRIHPRRREAPQGDDPEDRYGIASGLWVSPDGDSDLRTFLSTAPKASTAKNAAVDASKFATRENKKGETVIDTGKNASNPGIVAERGHLDVVADLAYPLPVHTICGMLGIPVQGHPGLGQRTQLCCYDPAVFAGTGPEVMDQAILARDADLSYYARPGRRTTRRTRR